MNDKAKAKYRRYDEAFKREAVEHWMVSGKSGRQIAGELGINEQSLKVWKQKFKQLPAAPYATYFAEAASARNFSIASLNASVTMRVRVLRVSQLPLAMRSV